MRSEAKGPDGRGGPHVFVTDLDAPEIDDHDRHHLSRVLRTADGEPLTVCDGSGRWRPCRFGPSLEPTGDVVEVSAPEVEVAVGFSLIKGGRPDLVVQKLTELGVDRIVPLVASRSVVHWAPEKARAHRDRFLRVSREASMQSRRVRLPVIMALTRVGAVSATEGVAMAEPGGGPVGLDHPMVLIGPEGGWTKEELDSCPRCSLGGTVLRSETAAIVAGALLTALRDRRVAPLNH